MLNRIYKALMISAFFTASISAHATPVMIDAGFNFGWSGDLVFSGTIEGTDLNSDGIITTNEVTNIYENLSGHTLPSLSAIGDINIASETWTPNGLSWPSYPDMAYMTFDNRAWSCSALNGCSVAFTSFTTTGASVPEPATLALIGLALAGLAISRRRKV